MKTYLFTWNPQKWHWVDLPEAVYKINTGQEYNIYWSCGNTKKIQIGDRFYLMKLGTHPKGIIGTGQILSKPYKLPHWDITRAKKGDKALRVDLIFDTLSESPILSERILESPPLNKQNWFPQSSGTTIPILVALQIEKVWVETTKKDFTLFTQKELEKISEGVPKK